MEKFSRICARPPSPGTKARSVLRFIGGYAQNLEKNGAQNGNPDTGNR
jgi:hypothetical protein